MREEKSFIPYLREQMLKRFGLSQEDIHNLFDVNVYVHSKDEADFEIERIKEKYDLHEMDELI